MHTELPADRLHRRIGVDADSTDEEPEGERADTALSRWLPEPASPGGAGWVASIRADPGRAGVVALAIVGVLAVLVTVFTLMRDSTPPVSSAKLPAVQMVSSAAPTPGGSTPAAAAPESKPDQPVVVSVVGLVHKPGLVTLGTGARIADALTAAGGAVDGADLIGLNMARRVTDGEQIIVGIAARPGAPAAMGSSVGGVAPAQSGPPTTSGAQPAPGGLVDLNTATEAQLDELPGVGPVTAAAIVAWRQANGRFTSVDQLGDVDGIGPSRLEKLRKLVRV